MWQDLNTKEHLLMKNTNITPSSFRLTVKSKRNRPLEKYWLFLLEESDRIFILALKIVTN